MRRRDFIALLGGAPLSWPMQAHAQQRRPARIGALHPFSSPHPWVAGLRRGLRDLGYVEGQTVAIDERGSEGRDERLEDLVEELIGSKVDVLVAMTGSALRAAKRRTNTVPIVIAVSSDGVGGRRGRKSRAAGRQRHRLDAHGTRPGRAAAEHA
jgi:putative ABC transport system substrate-binding protein